VTEPKQKRGESAQDYGTPIALIRAVEARWGPLAWDLAAREDNRKAPKYLCPKQVDSLREIWHDLCGNLWLNPPFADIGPWAKKCAEESRLGACVFLLTPASVGSVWFSKHVHGRAKVHALQPRLTFEGQTQPYPKDCMISCFGPSIKPGFDVWRWDVPQEIPG
jgi:phage N-6-adenine-methyltransferase